MGLVHILSHSPEPFADRCEAGCLLARELERFRASRPVVLGIPRGGIVIAAESTKVSRRSRRTKQPAPIVERTWLRSTPKRR